jgi:thiamine-phosphate pyrophosphorylase
MVQTAIGDSQTLGERRRERLERARLYLVTAPSAGGRPAPKVVGAALAGGTDVVQLRAKEAGDEETLAVARELRALCDAHGALLIVNDRPDLALACAADGVHVGQDDDSVDCVRARVGAELVIGVSTHSETQVDAACRSQADYLGVGPVYATPTKPQAEPVGLALVRYASATAGKPFFAIGGIDAERAAEVAAAGAARVAVVRAVCEADDPRAAAAALVERLRVRGRP